MRNNDICRCEEYPFPHRLYGGECRGHNLEFCPRPERTTDPYGTGDHWYAHIEHGCTSHKHNGSTT